MSSNAFTQNLINSEKNLIDSPASKDLILPIPKVLEENNQKLYAWTPEGYAIIQKIYVGYIRWINYINEVEELKEGYEKRLLIFESRLNLKRQVIEELFKDREWIYEQREIEQQKFLEEEKRYKRKLILYTSGGILAGGLIGIITCLIIY